MPREVTIDPNSIRHQFDEKTKKWYFSVIDVIAIVTDSSDPRNYWKVLKNRLHKANPQLVTACNQLKLPSSDGKSYLTDVAEGEVILEIIRGISSDFTTPLRLYFEKIEATYPHIGNAFLGDVENSEEAELPIDMYSTPTHMVIISFVPGTNIEDIFISTGYREITIKGKRISSKKEKCTSQEIYWGTFSRTISLPTEIHIDGVEATASHGVLTIRLPKVDILRTRIIKVR